jgi:putative cell wall-binding protein
MLKRKKIVSKLLATTMVLTSFTVNASAAEVTSTTIGGNDRYETAIKISENGWSKSDRAILINGEKGLVDALTATPYAYSKNAPILITAAGKLSPATANRLKAMDVKNVDIVGGVNSVSNQVVNDLKAMGITVNRISGASRYDTSLAVAKELDKIQDVSEIAVVNGDKGIPDAVSVAAPAASKKMPILLAENSGLNSASKDFVNGESVSKSYVIGSNNSVSDSVMNSLPGTKTRLGGADRHDTNAAVIKEFYTAASWNNVYVAKSGFVKTNDEIVDALAAGVLAAKNGNPIVLVGKNMNSSQISLLGSKKFTKMTQIGMGIPTDAITQIKNTQADEESAVSSVSVVDYRTLKISGKLLDKLGTGNFSVAGNTVSSYTANASGTEATLVFSKGFSANNTLKVSSNLGKETTHSFSYKVDIASVQAVTKEIAVKGIQSLEFTVNNEAKPRSLDEIKALGWKVEFKSDENIFYGGNGDADKNSPTSETGKLRTKINSESGIPFSENQLFLYTVTLTKDSVSLKSEQHVKVVNKITQISEITSFKIQTEDGVVLSDRNNLITNEKAKIVEIKGKDKAGNVVDIDSTTFNSSYTVKSSKADVVLPNVSTNELKAQNPGSASITISDGTVTSKAVTVNVSNGPRELGGVVFTPDKISIIKSTSGTVIAKLTDLKGESLKGKAIFTEGNKIKNASGEIIAEVKTISLSDVKGESTIVIEATDKTGTGSISVNYKNSANTTVTKTLSVTVGDTTIADSWNLEIDKSKSLSKDEKIDVYSTVKDNTISLDLKSYAGAFPLADIDFDKIKVQDGSSNDIPNTDYYIASDKPECVSVSKDNIDEKILLTANKANSGKINIKVYKDGNIVYKDKVNNRHFQVEVVDTTPKITAIGINNSALNVSIDSAKASSDYDVINSLFKITNDIEGSIVQDVTILGTGGTIIYTPGTDKVDGTSATYGKLKIGNTAIGTISMDTSYNELRNSGKIDLSDSELKGKSLNAIVKVFHGDDTKNLFKTYNVTISIQ